VAWVAAASHQRWRVERGAPGQQPFASIGVGWAAAMLFGLIAFGAGIIVALIAIARGAPVYG
jgi:hypothetical protein